MSIVQTVLTRALATDSDQTNALLGLNKLLHVPNADLHARACAFVGLNFLSIRPPTLADEQPCILHLGALSLRGELIMANNVKKTAVPVNERVKKLRAARREAGLVKVELWVHKSRKSEAKSLEKSLQKPLK